MFLLYALVNLICYISLLFVFTGNDLSVQIMYATMNLALLIRYCKHNVYLSCSVHSLDIQLDANV